MSALTAASVTGALQAAGFTAATPRRSGFTVTGVPVDHDGIRVGWAQHRKQSARAVALSGVRSALLQAGWSIRDGRECVIVTGPPEAGQ